MRTVGVFLGLVLGLAGCSNRALPGGADATLTDAPGAVDARAPVADRGAPAADTILDPVALGVRACVLAASCFPVIGLPSRCIDQLALVQWPRMGYWPGTDAALTAKFILCARDATASKASKASCSAFFACFGGRALTPDMCAEGATCKGSRLMLDPLGKTFLDCAKQNATCVDLPTGAQRACCTVRPCNQTNQLTCRGAKGTFCSLGVRFDFDCGPSNRTCTSLDSALCQGKGGPCKVGDKLSCSGSRVTFCSGGDSKKWNYDLYQVSA